MESKRGFTLIELLVVIAIIGILSSIVLVSMRGATDRAKDARIMGDMGQIRSAGEVYYGNNGNYTSVCSDTDIATLQADIVSAEVGGTNYACNASATAYCVEVEMNSGKFWCIDSALRSKRYDANPATCAAAAYTCE